MNFIINKKDKIIIWTNSHPTKLTGKEAFFDFNEKEHDAIFCENFVAKVGEKFVPDYQDGKALEHFDYIIWNKNNPSLFRKCKSWNDGPTNEETVVEPLKDDLTYIPFQIFDGVKWIIDQKAKKLSILNKLKSEINSSDWRMTVDKFNSMPKEEQIYWTDEREKLRVQIREIQKSL